MYDINCLAQCFQDVKGTSNGSQSLNYKLRGEDMMELVYTTVVHIASDASLQTQTKNASEMSVAVINDAMKLLKSKYKASSGKTLKLKEISSDDTVEIISTTFHSPRKIGLYKKHVIFQIE